MTPVRFTRRGADGARTPPSPTECGFQALGRTCWPPDLGRAILDTLALSRLPRRQLRRSRREARPRSHHGGRSQPRAQPQGNNPNICPIYFLPSPYVWTCFSPCSVFPSH
nr:uncharacterized protein LOC104650624 [Saimiri boliviensis boliviensis]